ncbi:MAG: peptidoglycan editing factor PgeF [Epsilonproteobacteria bacterium]|nr:peptidoglycan editing factor PgeF [Campylobacterota bacterium]
MTLLSSNLFSQYLHISAHFTTRHGGVSSSPYGTFNLAFHVGDNAQDVLKNHHILADRLGYDPKSLIHMHQIHSNIIIPVNSTMNFDTVPQCDALITNHTNIPLMVMSADCTPILLYDPVNHAIGAVHAGRAGALNRILPLTLEAMQKNYNTALSDIQIVFGPSIQGCCYEINETIAHEVKEKGYEDALLWRKEKVSLDVNTILHMQLKALGITSEQIESINQCTACNSHNFFSYRADSQHTGRIAGVIFLRPLPS